MKNFTTIIVLVAILVSCFQPVYAVDDCKLYGYCTEDTSNEIIKTKDKKINNSKSITWSSSNINLAVNGEKISFPDQKPMLSNEDRTYVPVRFLAEALGAEVDWDNDNETVIIKNYFIEGRKTRAVHYLKIGESKIVTAQYNDGFNNPATHISVFYMDVFPVILNERTMLPFRHISEVLGARVFYDPNTNTAHCEKKDLSNAKSPSRYYVDPETKLKMNGTVDMDSFPILSTLFQDYFVEALNEERMNYWKDAVEHCKTLVGFGGCPETVEDYKVKADGSLSDICTWAAFDHNLNYEFAKYDQLSIGSMHIFSNMLPEGGFDGIREAVKTNEYGWVDGSKAVFGVWHPYHKYHEDKYGVDMWPRVKSFYNNEEVRKIVSYKENAMQIGSVFRFWNRDKNFSERNSLRTWGINLSQETELNIWDEQDYKNLAIGIIDTYKTSKGHYYTLLDGHSKYVGVSVFGDYSYMNLTY